MGRFRQHIAEARGKLHEYMSVPALYFPWPLNGATPRAVTVRVHDKFTQQGDLKGTSFHYAEAREVVPTAIFLRSEIEPVRNMCFRVESGEAYRVDVIDPADGITVSAKLVRLRADQLTGMPTLPSAYAGARVAFPCFGAAGQSHVGKTVAASLTLPRVTVRGLGGSGSIAIAKVTFPSVEISGEG